MLSRFHYAIVFIALMTASPSIAESPNILVILVDDMGYGDPGCYNPQSKISTPNIDSLANDGMRFTDAHASGPLCHISRYGLMTGRYPFRANVGKWPKSPVIDPGQMTVPSMLKLNGYRTAMVGKWHLGFAEQGYDKPLPGGPVDVGFDQYFGIRASTDIPPYFYIRDRMAVQPPSSRIGANSSDGWSPIQGAFWRAGGIAPDLALKDVLPRFTDEAITVLQSHDQKQPLMLYLAYPAPHTPWLPSEKFLGKSGAGMYGDFAMMVDDQIGKVLKTLEKTGMADDTLVIFSSDNGPVWYDKDVDRLGHDSSGGLRGMKADAWECGHRMPFIARWPGKIAHGSTSDQMICFTDLLATFASLVGFSLPEKAGPDSYDFSRVLFGQQPPDEPVRQHLVIKAGRHFLIRKGEWKLITGLGSGGFSKPSRIEPGPGDPRGQLYHLGHDRAETKNLYLQNQPIVNELSSKLQEIRDAEGQRYLR